MPFIKVVAADELTPELSLRASDYIKRSDGHICNAVAKRRLSEAVEERPKTASSARRRGPLQTGTKKKG